MNVFWKDVSMSTSSRSPLMKIDGFNLVIYKDKHWYFEMITFLYLVVGVYQNETILALLEESQFFDRLVCVELQRNAKMCRCLRLEVWTTSRTWFMIFSGLPTAVLVAQFKRLVFFPGVFIVNYLLHRSNPQNVFTCFHSIPVIGLGKPAKTLVFFTKYIKRRSFR